MNQRSIDDSLFDATDGLIGFIQADWHDEIVDQARQGFERAMADAACPPDLIERFHVPGVLEIPLLAQQLAASGRFRILVAAGLIVDGGIYRHDFVAATVSDAMMQVQLATGIPLLSVVLTPQAFHEHDTHRAFFTAHFAVKGAEAAAACLQVMGNQRRLAGLAAA